MLRSMTMRQFQEWNHYATLEPWDEKRQDWRTAHIVCVLLNQHRKKGSRPIKLEECLLPFGEPAESRPTTAEDARAAIARTMDLLMHIHNRPEKKKRKR